MASLPKRRKEISKQFQQEAWKPNANVLRYHSANINDDDVYQMLIENEDLSQEEMKQTLRATLQTLTMKRRIIQRLHSCQHWEKKIEKVSTTSMKQNFSMNMKELKCDVRDVLSLFDIWHTHLKEIQGHFGTGVASYFYFLRWLFLLNLAFFLFPLCFIIVPQAIHPVQNSFNQSNYTYDKDFLFDTLMYYGYYWNGTIGTISYSMPEAYIFSMSFYFIFWLIASAYSLAHAYQNSFVEMFGRSRNLYSNKIFCGWDFTIETAEAARLKSRSIYNNLLEELSHHRRGSKVVVIENPFMYIFRLIFINAVVVATMCSLGYLIYYLLEIKALKTNIQFLAEMAISLTITTIIFVVPMFYIFLSKYEMKDKLVQLYLTLFRIVTLEIIILGMVVYFWFFSSNKNDNHFCWETMLGQEIVRLLIVDFAFILIFQVLIGEVFRHFLHKHFPKLVSSLEFPIAWNTLSLIYTQTLTWIGTFYSPLLPLVTIIKLFLIFYVKRYSVLFNCKPSAKPWYAANVHTVFVGLTFGNFILALIAVTYTVFNMTPSSLCGPFRHYETRYESILQIISSLGSKSTFGNLIAILLSPGLVSVILLLFCVLVYYVRVKAKAHKDMVSLLKEHLNVESKDKAFLLKLIEKASKEHIQAHKISSVKQKQKFRENVNDFEMHPYNTESAPIEVINHLYQEKSLNRNSFVDSSHYSMKDNPIYMEYDTESSPDSCFNNSRHRLVQKGPDKFRL
ncbi:transmembrane channel-like protein 5 [Centruroides vittatus]|uniref:transmembrane channel-like protein 5 n=1 Tax=Centruroides vittatus TaxID=120091 RepID=UPI00350F189D